MGLRAVTAIAVLCIAFAGPAGQALAQYYPPPARAYPPYRPLPPVLVEEDPSLPAYDPPGGYVRPNAPPGLYPAPPPGAQYDRLVPPADVELYQQPAPRYGRAAPMPPPDMDAYVPPPPPGYIFREPPPGYEPVEPRGNARAYPPQNVAPNVAPNMAPGAMPPPAAMPPSAPPGAAEPQEAMRPPLPIGPGQIVPGQAVPNQEVTGTVKPDPGAMISALPPDYRPETGPAKQLPPQFRRTVVDYRTKEPVGTIIIDTPSTYLYLVMPGGKAMRYGVGVGREGFTWNGAEKVSKMAEWPDWHPPEEMIERQPYLPRFMAGGEGNPLGARALYLGKTLYRIHGTNQPSTIGTFVSSGCIRLTNEDVTDLYSRVKVGTRVVVLPGGKPPATASAAPPAAALPPPVSVR